MIHLFCPPFEMAPHGYRVNGIITVSPKLFPEGAVQSFHHLHRCGGTGREDKELKTILPAGFFKLSVELTPSITSLPRTGKGLFLRNSSRNSRANPAVALV
ncbi:MAG: hypothetical protein ACUVTO_09380 [Candidatus Caldatribacteriaceae bacterium]